MLSIVVGILLLYIGAETLVRGSSQLAQKLGIPPLVIGLTIVAFGTSSPELLVSISAALRGSSDVAVGNVVGSNIFNVAVILGLTALIKPPKVHSDLIRREIPVLIIVSMLGFVVISSGNVTRLVGILLFFGLCYYCWYCIQGARKHPNALPADVSGSTQMSSWLCGILIVAGLSFLIFGANLFVAGAVAVARGFGMSEALIGLTIVAAGTSLPELATSIVAAIKREPDVAIGNVVGSNIFNILGILGVTASILPLEVSGIGIIDVGYMLGLAVLLLPFAFSQRSISRFEGGIFLSMYGIYLYLLWPS